MSLSVDISGRKKYKVKGPAAVFMGGDNKDEGEFQYETTGNGKGKCTYMRMNSAGTALEKKTLLVQEDIDSAVNAIAKQERIRFQLYPSAAKDSWLANQMGHPSAVPIGYQFKVINWKVWVLPTEAYNSSNHLAVNYMQTVGTVVAALNGNASSMVNKNVGFVNPANGTIGLFFKGTTNPKKIQLMVNGAVKDGIDMEAEGGVADGGNGTPLNKLYIAEITIQLDNSNINLVEE